MNFDTLNLNKSVMDGARALGYYTPTPIVLPVLHLLTNGSRSQVRALILAPTRELAEQTDTVISELGQRTSLRNIAVYGGANMDQQIQRLRNGIEIVVACPGRLLDHLWKGSIDLSHLEILVIDEADRMLDMGFLPDIKNILNCMFQKRQTLHFSATMPANIQRLAREIMYKPVMIQINPAKVADMVSHTIYSVEENNKTMLLKDILEHTETKSVLVLFLRS